MQSGPPELHCKNVLSHLKAAAIIGLFALASISSSCVGGGDTAFRDSTARSRLQQQADTDKANPAWSLVPRLFVRGPGDFSLRRLYSLSTFADFENMTLFLILLRQICIYV